MEVDGRIELDPASRMLPGQRVAVLPRVPSRPPASVIVFEDRHLVVAEKPEGISSVPYRQGERGTLMDAIRREWRGRGVSAAERVLHVVHRLDKETSGLLVFARTRTSERALQMQFRRREVSRVYLLLAHGSVRGGRIESRLVPDRGDGIRGSKHSSSEGKPAVTHVRLRERLPRVSLCEARLETGRTHQIRIHLAESGHPIVGERVYMRDFVTAGGKPIPSRRLMLHASTLDFEHPVRGGRLSFESRENGRFLAIARALGKAAP